MSAFLDETGLRIVWSKVQSFVNHYITDSTESGLLVADKDGNVVLKYNSDGFDVNAVTSHFKGLVLPDQPTTSNWYQGYTTVDTDGITQIGKQINFHPSSTSNYAISLKVPDNTMAAYTLTLPSSSGTLALDSKFSNYSLTSHTHDISLTQKGTASITLAHNTTYTLTAGGESIVFKMPSDNNTWTALKGATSTADGTAGYAPKPAKGDQAKFLKGDATWTEITPSLIGAAASSHTHNYRANTSPSNGAWWQGTPLVDSDGVMEIGKYIDFHYTKTSTLDFSVRLICPETSSGIEVTLPSSKGTLALASDYIPLKGSSITAPITGILYAKNTDGLYINSENKDLNIWHIVGNGSTWDSTYGFNLQYAGTNSGNNNDLVLWAHNQADTHKEVYRVHQDGSFIFNSTPKVGSNNVIVEGDSRLTNTRNTTNSLTITKNSGTTEGTDKWTFNGSAAKTINLGTNAFSNTAYLPLSGGTMSNNAFITWKDSGSWNAGTWTSEAKTGGLSWSGQSDYVKIFASETAKDNLDLVIQFGDDNSNGLSIRNSSAKQTAYLTASGILYKTTYNTDSSGTTTSTNTAVSYTDHTHGSITSAGAISTEVTIANGDKLLISDSSDNSKIKRVTVLFDGLTKTQALTKAGTWETFNNYTYTLPTAKTDVIGGIKIHKDNSSYSVTAGTSAISANVTGGPYYGVEIDTNDKAFVYVPWTYYIADNGRHTETASGTAATDKHSGMKFSSGMYMTRTYNETSKGMPTPYGNVLNMAGEGDSQLLLGWSGTDSVTARMYYRSHRDTDSGGWGSWKTVAWTTDKLANPYSLTAFGVSYDGSVAKTVDKTTFVGTLTEATGTVTDGTMFITSYASDNGFADSNAVNVPYKRKASCLYNYLKNKLTAGTGISITHATDNTSTTIANSAPLYFVDGTNTTTSGAWTGNLPTGVTEYYNGLTIRFRLSASPSGNATLQLGSLAACPVYINQNSRVTTHYPKGSILTLTYYGGNWYMANYDSSTYDAARMGGAHLYAGVAVYCNTLVGIGVDGKAYPITSQRQSSANLITSATYDTNPRQFGILYRYTGGSKTAGNALQTYCLYEQAQLDWRYVDNCVNATYNASTNTMGLQVGKPVYIKVAIKDGGWYPVAQTTTGVYNGTSTYTRCWTQTEFTKGSNYIYVGIAYNNYCIFLTSKHGMYYAYDTNKLQSNEYNSATHTHTWASITNKIVADNEFNIVNSGYNNTMWFNYLPYDDRNKTATVSQYLMGNGNKGYASVKASTYYNINDTEVSYSGHQHYIGTSSTQASSANQLLSGVMLTGIDNTVSHALLQSGANRTDDANGDTWIFWDSKGGSSTPWGFKHNQKDNYIEFYGSGTRRCFIDLNSVTNPFNGSADKLDGWHKDNLNWTGHITSNTSGLSSYWGKIWDATIINSNCNDITLTLLISANYAPSYHGIVVVGIRQNGANKSGAYNFGVHLLQISGNIPSSALRLYYDNSTGACSLWGNVTGIYGTINTTVLKKSYRTATDSASIGTLYSTTFSTAQTLPTSSYIELSHNLNYAKAVQLNTTRTLWGQNFNGTANVTGSLTGVNNINTSESPIGTIYANNWFRSIGATGWYSETYGGGWYMSDTTWIRNWGSKAVYLNANLCVGNNAKIGIGTTSPSYTLDASGTSRIQKHLILDAGTKELGTQWDGGLIAGKDGHTKVVASYLASSTNAATIGAHTSNLDDWGKLNIAGTNLQFSIKESPKMYLDSSGNFGIGTTIPTHKLHVDGDGYLTNTLHINPTNATGSYDEGIRVYAKNNWSTIMLNGSDNTAMSGTSANSWIFGNNNGNLYINKASSSTQKANRLWGHSNGWTLGNTSVTSYALNVGGTTYTSKLLAVNTQNSITVGANGNDDSYLNSLSHQLIVTGTSSNGTIRFGTTSWDWNQWAGLKYTHSNKTIDFGIADGTVFTANNVQTDGSLNLVNIKNLHTQADFNITGATKITSSAGLEITNVISGASYAASEGLYTPEQNNLILRGDATYGKSGILFTSSKGTTSINQTSDKAFIQFQSYGGTATSGEANRFVIGCGNDSNDYMVLQTPLLTGLKHCTPGGTLYTVASNGDDNSGIVFRSGNLLYTKQPRYVASTASSTTNYSNYQVLGIRSKTTWDSTNSKSVNNGYEQTLLEIVRGGTTAVNNPNGTELYSFVKSINMTSNAPTSTTGWYNMLQLVHRNGVDDGPDYIGQIALGMTVNYDRLFLRSHYNRTWKEAITKTADNKAVGSATQPVYISSSGVATACTAYSSASVASAAKWTTKRTLSFANSDVVGSISIDGSDNVTSKLYQNNVRAINGATNNYPYHRIATCTTTSNYFDGSLFLFITEDFVDGYCGLVHVSTRTNNMSTTANALCSVKWIWRRGISTDSVTIAQYKTTGSATWDIFVKTRGAYCCYIIRTWQGYRGTIGYRWTMYNSNENYNSSTKTYSNTEVYSTIAAAGTALHSWTYTDVVTGTDTATVNYANSAGSVAWSDVSDKPIATTSVLGLVKSATTGTAANRDYNVQVNPDGTMKVNVPWTDTKVTQTAVTASDYSNWQPLIWGSSSNGNEGFTPATVTDQVYTANTLSCQPNKGWIRAKLTQPGGTYNWYAIQQYDSSGKNNPSYFVNNCAIINITTYAGYQPWIRAVSSDKASWALGQYSNEVYLARIANSNTSNGNSQQWKFTSGGNLEITGSFYANSDIRYKNVLSNIETSIENIAELPIFNFNWKDSDSKEIHIGTSAQAVQKILSNAVSGDERLSLDYASLGVIEGVVAAREIVKLKKRVEELEQKLMEYGGHNN